MCTEIIFQIRELLSNDQLTDIFKIFNRNDEDFLDFIFKKEDIKIKFEEIVNYFYDYKFQDQKYDDLLYLNEIIIRYSKAFNLNTNKENQIENVKKFIQN